MITCTNVLIPVRSTRDRRRCGISSLLARRTKPPLASSPRRLMARPPAGLSGSSRVSAAAATVEAEVMPAAALGSSSAFSDDMDAILVSDSLLWEAMPKGALVRTP